MTLKLSVVFGTLNRRVYLERCLESIRESAAGLPYEIVIVDGGSTDGSLDFLRQAAAADAQVRLIEQGERLGAGRAFNAGFFAAKGEYVCNLNDDCAVVGDTLPRACDYLDAHPEVGQLAIPFSLPDEPAHVDYVGLWNRRLLYANFGVTRRALGNEARWWGDVYQYSGDTELSIKIWLMNRYVAPLPGGQIIHYQARDETRVPNIESHRIGKLYHNVAPPPIVKRLGVPTPETNLRRSGPRPAAPRTQVPGRIIVKKKRKQLQGVEGLTLVRYLGNGWQVRGAPTGTAYCFSGGAEFYVDDRDLEFILNHVPAGEKVSQV